jgi:PKD domain-containing protein
MVGGMRGLTASVVALAVLCAFAPDSQAARTWHPPIELSAPDADAWIGKVVPSLSVMADGTAISTWVEGDRDSSAVKVAEKPLGAPLAPAHTLGGGWNPPSVATTLDGRAYVAWVGTTTNDRSGETVLVSERLEGGAYSSPHAVAEGALWSSQPGTAVAANARGEAVVLFTSGSWNNQQLWTARRTSDGEWHAAQPLGDPIGEAVWRLHAGMSETGEAVFAWLSWDPDRGTSAWTAIERVDGPAHDVRRMQSGDDRSTLPSLAVDHLGNAIVSWTELSSDDADIAGKVRAAVRAPGQPFGPPIDLGGSGFEMDSSIAGISDDGHAIVTWQAATRNGDYGASLGGAVAVAGIVPAGVFTAPEQVSTSWLVDTPLTVAVDPVGNAAFFWVDWDTGEQRVVRRSVGGFYGRERAVVSCPRTRTYPIAAAVDPFGNASLFWTESSFGKAAQGVRLSQDEPSAAFSPDPCPAPPPPLTWSPKDPAPGANVSFDASGSRYPDAAGTTFKWDFDGDGDYETDTGETPTASHAFSDPGEHPVGLQVHVESHDPGNSVTWSCVYRIRVGTPPDPPNEYPVLYADPRPPDEPDENPWPVAPRLDVPTLPEVPPWPPLPVQPALPGLTSLPPAPGQARATLRRGLVVEAPRSVRARGLMGSGVLVRLTSARKLRVRLRLLGKRTVAGPVAVRVPAGRQVIVRLRPTRSGRRILHASRVRSLNLEAVAGKHTKVRQRIRVR